MREERHPADRAQIEADGILRPLLGGRHRNAGANHAALVVEVIGLDGAILGGQLRRLRLVAVQWEIALLLGSHVRFRPFVGVHVACPITVSISARTLCRASASSS